MKSRILKIAFLVWIALWISFIARELFAKGNIRDYRVLLSRSLEGKRYYVVGDKLYEFIAFCKKTVPIGSAYHLIGIEDGAVDKIRAIYYLYPNVKRDEPEYIFVYDKPAVKKAGYSLFAKLDDNRYILKK